MTQTYADICLERVEKAPNTYRLDGPRDYVRESSNFYHHARTDVPELARRLKKACELLRAASNVFGKLAGYDCAEYDYAVTADELEAMPEEK